MKRRKYDQVVFSSAEEKTPQRGRKNVKRPRNAPAPSKTQKRSPSGYSALFKEQNGGDDEEQKLIRELEVIESRLKAPGKAKTGPVVEDKEEEDSLTPAQKSLLMRTLNPKFFKKSVPAKTISLVESESESEEEAKEEAPPPERKNAEQVVREIVNTPPDGPPPGLISPHLRAAARLEARSKSPMRNVRQMASPVSKRESPMGKNAVSSTPLSPVLIECINEARESMGDTIQEKADEVLKSQLTAAKRTISLLEQRCEHLEDQLLRQKEGFEERLNELRQMMEDDPEEGELLGKVCTVEKELSDSQEKHRKCALELGQHKAVQLAMAAKLNAAAQQTVAELSSERVALLRALQTADEKLKECAANSVPRNEDEKKDRALLKLRTHRRQLMGNLKNWKVAGQRWRTVAGGAQGQLVWASATLANLMKRRDDGDMKLQPWQKFKSKLASQCDKLKELLAKADKKTRASGLDVSEVLISSKPSPGSSKPSPGSSKPRQRKKAKPLARTVTGAGADLSKLPAKPSPDKSSSRSPVRIPIPTVSSSRSRDSPPPNQEEEEEEEEDRSLHMNHLDSESEEDPSPRQFSSPQSGPHPPSAPPPAELAHEHGMVEVRDASGNVIGMAHTDTVENLMDALANGRIAPPPAPPPHGVVNKPKFDADAVLAAGPKVVTDFPVVIEEGSEEEEEEEEFALPPGSPPVDGSGGFLLPSEVLPPDEDPPEMDDDDEYEE